MRRLLVILAIVGLAAGQVNASALVTLRVTADRVNLRARPSLQSETIAQVGTGDTLQARQVGDEWAEVVPPGDIAFFVHRDFVRDGIVDVARLNVRAGPGINYSDMGGLTRGDKVTVIGEFADWLKIVPPATASVWVSREYVETVGQPARPTPPRPAPAPPTPPTPPVVTPPPPPPAPTPAPAVTPAPPAPKPVVPAPPPPPPPPAPPAPRPPPVIIAPPPPPPLAPEPTPPMAVTPPRVPAPAAAAPAPMILQRMGLVPQVPQGRPTVHEGYLTRSSFLLIRPSPFRLIERGRGRVVTLCYVMGNESQLDGLVGRELAIHGKQYWLQGTRHPVLVAERIVLRNNPLGENP